MLATTISSFLFSIITYPFHESSHATAPNLIAPKVFIINMFTPEANAWYGIPEFDILAQNITVPGFSPLFPDAHCTSDGQICQMVTGEGEINAATSVSALVFSPAFDLSQTYFIIAGVGGVNPEVASTGSVTFAKYAVQVAMQREIDAREIPENFSSGYFSLHTSLPGQYPEDVYGTEVFEVSEALRDIAVQFASNVTLKDTPAAQAHRARYAANPAYAIGAAGPRVQTGDVATSDVFYTGELLSKAFGETVTLFTNGSGTYCTTAQEDNATLEVLLRSALADLVDFARIIILRATVDFDRPPPGITAIDHILYHNPGTYVSAYENLYLAGVRVVMGIIDQWDSGFARGVEPGNYIGDMFNSLGGRPDFGNPRFFVNPAGEGRKGGLEGRAEMMLERRRERMVGGLRRRMTGLPLRVGE